MMCTNKNEKNIFSDFLNQKWQHSSYTADTCLHITEHYPRRRNQKHWQDIKEYDLQGR